MYKVGLDTNVIISAIVFGGKPRMIIEDILEGKYKLGISEPIMAEVQAVIESRKFKFPARISHLIINELVSISSLVNPKNKLEVIKKDPEDNRILECAYEYKADFIITGDTHLLEVGKYKNTRIIAPADFLKEL